ncbi:hypothetical protein CPT_Palo_013 [Rhizobium phage Palo]|uniref:Uncharacterized protein n=1 Tax=Rhizobium phage Palo TaxID=2767573 RepID=A0A7L8G4T5_9CAUD|nr:hypothetical protein CPT_Palo_013 [Rhizobium phage Palo]
MSQGVCSHSTIEAQSEYVIFGTYEPDTAEQFLQLTGKPFKRLLVSDGEERGVAFLVQADLLAAVDQAGCLHNIPTVTFLQRCDARGRRPAWVIKTDSFDEHYVGHFTETVLGSLPGQPYTYDPQTKRTFVLVKPHNAAARPLQKFSRDELAEYRAYRERVERKS